jgi:hypothetical protein
MALRRQQFELAGTGIVAIAIAEFHALDIPIDHPALSDLRHSRGWRRPAAIYPIAPPLESTGDHARRE